MSTISSSSYQPPCTPAQAPRKTTQAASAARLVNRRDAITRAQHGEGDEGEEPGDVEVEPVREHELEPDQDRAGQGRELERRLVPGEEREGERAGHDQHLER